MSAPKRILATTDFSEASRAPFMAAVAMARHYGARLGLAHVVSGAGPIHPLFPKFARHELLEIGELERRASEALRAYATELIGDAPIDLLVSVTSGYIEAETIVEKAKVFAADCIVVGSHGRTGIERAVLGSVAEKVVRLAPCDVLVARVGPAKEPAPVVAAVGLQELTQSVLETAAREAKARSEQLVAVYALDAPADVVPYGTMSPFGIFGTVPVPNMMAELRGVAADTLKAAMDAAGATGESVVLGGRAAPEVVRFAEERGAALIVCSTHGRTGLERLTLGSVAESIVRHAPCSVLVVR